jgi:polysaccharide biosynthesis/export protein
VAEPPPATSNATAESPESTAKMADVQGATTAVKTPHDVPSEEVTRTAQTEPTLDTYHIGPGDTLTIKVYQLLEIEKEALLDVPVDPTGQVYLPLLNHVQVAGMTCDQLRRELVSRLGQEFIRDPQVSVSVKTFGSKEVMVLGMVHKPGALPLPADSVTLMDVIGLAGGITGEAAPVIEILRGAYDPASTMPAGSHDPWQPARGAHYRREQVPVVRLFAQDGKKLNPVIYPGDVVRVPADSEGVVYLDGEVRQPGAKNFRRPLNVLQAVSTAGGLTDVAGSKKCKVVRRTTDGDEKVILVDLDKVRQGKQDNLVLARNDTILVPADPVKQFFAGLSRFFRMGVNGGVDMTYDAGADTGMTTPRTPID